MSNYGYEDGKLYHIALAELVPSDDQPRKFFCPEALEELKVSIRENQLLEAILFTASDDRLVILSGERRCKAMKDLGHEEILGRYIATPQPVLPIIANLQREDLLPLEKAEALSTLKEKLGYSHEDLAAIIGKSVSTVSEMIKLNCLTDEIKEECRNSKRFVYSRLLQIANISNKRTMLSRFRDYKMELDGKPQKKRIIKKPNYSRLAVRIDGLIKDFQKLEQENGSRDILISLSEKLDELKIMIHEKINNIESLRTSDFRNDTATVENSSISPTASPMKTTSSSDNCADQKLNSAFPVGQYCEQEETL